MNKLSVLKQGVYFTNRSLVVIFSLLSIIYIILFSLVLWLLFMPVYSCAEQIGSMPNNGQPIKIETEIKDYAATLGITRGIYDPNGYGEELLVENSQDYPMLVQSKTLGESTPKNAPFVVAPQLFRLDDHQRGYLRIVRTGGDTWAKSNKNDKAHTVPTLEMKVSLNRFIKRFTRLARIHCSPSDVAGSAKWF